ncbi:phosphate acyltransferase PlsX [Ponticaulis koreensis]|uniref:phosphate acyltransferase PlsX n=1 Tax=Ponticaulis koreensis TaxID=1123045 RepID=UPI0003B6C5A3|nr:phosphate acyltransferase PlsX [Ponticaulis koreensis]
MTAETLVLSVDAMGGDHAPESVMRGVALLAAEGRPVNFLLHGDEAQLRPYLDADPKLARVCEIAHTDKAVSMDAKPSQALRGGKNSSMWNALQAVKSGTAHVAISAGNTGALMAMSKLVLRMVPGVHRPALAASWPSPRGASIVLDVGANVEADAEQLVEFAIMGAAYSKAIHGKTDPSIGLLNIGSEELKGIESVRQAAEMLKGNEFGLNYYGFVEGNDISMGTTDVVVTDGYTGNIALKTAEGTAKLVGGFVKEALTSSILSKLGAVLARAGLKQLKQRLDPGNVNGGVFLGLNGIVLKSHGGTDAEGFATTLRLAYSVGNSTFHQDVEASLSRFQASHPEAEEAVST